MKKQKKRILIRAPNWIGDQIIAYPFFHFLRATYPEAHIAVACVSWVESLQFKNLIDEVFVLPSPEKPGLLAQLQALEKGAEALRDAGKWDLGIALPNSFSSAWILFRAGAKVRRGYNADARRLLLTEPIPLEKRGVSHRSEVYLGLLPEAKIPKKGGTRFWGVSPENDLDPGIPGIVPSFDALRAWCIKDPAEPPTSPYWVLAPGSNAESRRWPVERFAALAQEIFRKTGWRGIIVGGPAESALAQKLMTYEDVNLEDRTGQGTVSSLWKIFKNAHFSVCNDSGLAHVASLCGSPVFIVWGAGHPSRTKPMGPGKVSLVLNPIECWPCERNFCKRPPGTQNLCLIGIDVDLIWKEIQSEIRF